MSESPKKDIGSGILFLKGRDEILAYYEQFRPAQMESFARYAFSKGYGAKVHGTDETWQACGRRLFGDRFIAAMERVVNEHRAASSGASPVEAIEPEF